MTRIAVFFLASVALVPTPAFAQQEQPPAAEQPPAEQPQAAPPQASVHEHDDIVVTGYVRELDILAGKSVMSGEELQRDVRAQLGDSLTKLPGVSATSFTPGASRPVLRGFQGERVRVLTDGIGSIDASNTSADHAVTIDPLTAEKIEVLRGPAVLLFGSGASGGAVNVVDRRIPRRVPDPYHLDVVGALGSAADERSIGGAFDFALGKGGLVLHFDGSFRKTDDVRTGGYVLSPELRVEQLEIAEEEAEEGHLDEAAEALELANLKGDIPNSAAEQKSGGLGLAYIGDKFSVGFSVSRFESDYGVPSRPGAEHHHEEEEIVLAQEEGHEEVTIGLAQTRFDLRSEYGFDGGFLDSVRLRVGAADYKHTEFEGGEVGTIFKNKGYEGRFELVQRDRGGWRGVLGAQYYHRDFDAVGAEAFLPPNKTDQLGLFALQEFAVGKVGAEIGARFEQTGVRDELNAIERDFSAFSGAVGAFVEPLERVKVGANLSHTERAPSAEELFSNGLHVATQSFELGDPDLATEKALGAEAYVRVERSAFTFNATVFATWFDNFIFQAATGEEQEELPVFQYFQRGARFRGIEVEGSARLFEAGGFRFIADGVADYVRASIDEGGPVPRIPPLRLLGGIEAQSDKVDGRIEVEWVDDQHRIAAFETPTEGYTMVNASLAWRPWGKSRETILMLSANNLFDVEARRHASFTKDFVPLAGRDVRLSARLSF